MARFPNTHLGLVNLAESMLAGFAQHTDIFTKAKPDSLRNAIDEFNDASIALAEAQKQAIEAAESKIDKFKQLQAEIKNQLLLSQIACDDDPAKLEYIGWGLKKAPQKIEIPATPSNLKVAVASTDGLVVLTWRKSKGGGQPRNYIIERMQFKDQWETAGVSYNREIRLINQPIGCKVQYRVKAANKSGESEPSEIVNVIL